MEIEIFVHGNGRKSVVLKVGEDDVLSEVLAAAGLFDKDDVIFIGDGEDDIADDEGEDDDSPVDPGATVKQVDLSRHRHVHVGRCKRIAVEVHYLGKTKKRKAAPKRTVGAIARWARRVFRIDPAVASEYVLQIAGTSEQPRPDTQLGELTKAPTCAIGFDLVKEVTPQGCT